MEENDNVEQETLVRKFKMTYTSGNFSYGQDVFVRRLEFGSKAYCYGKWREKGDYTAGMVDWSNGVGKSPDMEIVSVSEEFAVKGNLERVEERV